MTKTMFQNRADYLKILWQRPLNVYTKNASVFILGGEKDISDVLTLCEALYNIGSLRIKLGYPDSLHSTFQKFLPREMQCALPSSCENNFSIQGAFKIKQLAADYNLFVIGIGLSKSEETKSVIKKITDLNKPIIFYGEGILEESPKLYTTRTYPSIFFMNRRILGAWLGEKFKDLKSIENQPIQSFKNLIKELFQPSSDWTLIYNSETNHQTIIIQKERLNIFSYNFNLNVLLILTIAFWAQNIKMPFESVGAAAYVTRLWQENFKNINEIEKAINLIEKEGFYE